MRYKQIPSADLVDAIRREEAVAYVMCEGKVGGALGVVAELDDHDQVQRVPQGAQVLPDHTTTKGGYRIKRLEGWVLGVVYGNARQQHLWLRVVVVKTWMRVPRVISRPGGNWHKTAGLGGAHPSSAGAFIAQYTSVNTVMKNSFLAGDVSSGETSA